MVMLAVLVVLVPGACVVDDSFEDTGKVDWLRVVLMWIEGVTMTPPIGGKDSNVNGGLSLTPPNAGVFFSEDNDVIEGLILTPPTKVVIISEGCGVIERVSLTKVVVIGDDNGVIEGVFLTPPTAGISVSDPFDVDGSMLGKMAEEELLLKDLR